MKYDLFVLHLIVLNIFAAIQRFPTTRIRRPINRRAGNVINSGINRRRFNVKQTNTNAKPMPNLAKFPGNA